MVKLCNDLTIMGGPHLPGEGENGRETSPLSQSASGSMSENESGERSARHKLKQASLVAMENGQVHDAPGQYDDTAMNSSMGHEKNGEVANEGSEHPEEERGRMPRKRSFEELQSASEHVDPPNSETTDATLGHVRKRSRDHAFEATADNRARSRLESPGLVDVEGRDNTSSENAETSQAKHVIDVTGSKSENSASSDVDERNGNGRTQSLSRDREPSQAHANPSAVEEKASPSQGPSDGSASPRKKRSREQFDTEPIREQKIVATEEARAQRLSSEIGRAEGSLLVADGSTESGAYHNDVERKEGLARQTTADLSSPPGPPILPLPNSETARSSAFAASGFAALAKSSASPFTNLGAGGYTPSSFALDASKPPKPDSGGFLSFASPRSPPIEVSGSTAKSSPAMGNGGPLASPFATASGATAEPFGGVAFGSATGSGLHAGSKLTSFAASTGNAHIVSHKGNIQPFGSPDSQGREARDSESDVGDDEGASKHDSLSETDQRFQQQDGMLHQGLCFISSIADVLQLKQVKMAKSPCSLRELACMLSRITYGKRAAEASSNLMSHLVRQIRERPRQVDSSCAPIKLFESCSIPQCSRR